MEVDKCFDKFQAHRRLFWHGVFCCPLSVLCPHLREGLSSAPRCPYGKEVELGGRVGSGYCVGASYVGSDFEKEHMSDTEQWEQVTPSTRHFYFAKNLSKGVEMNGNLC